MWILNIEVWLMWLRAECFVLFYFNLINLIVYLNSHVWLVATWLDSIAVYEGCVYLCWREHGACQSGSLPEDSIPSLLLLCWLIARAWDCHGAQSSWPSEMLHQELLPPFLFGDTQHEGQVVFLSVTTGKSWILKATTLGTLAELSQVQRCLSILDTVLAQESWVRIYPSVPPWAPGTTVSFPPFQIYTMRGQIIFHFGNQRMKALIVSPSLVNNRANCIYLHSVTTIIFILVQIPWKTEPVTKACVWGLTWECSAMEEE